MHKQRSPATNVIVSQWPNGTLFTAALTKWHPAIDPRHFGVRCGFVEEDQVLRIEE